MKKFRFCALCLILAALLSACGRQAAQDVPSAAAVPSPAAVPEAPAESTSTPSPTAPAEIGKELPEQVKVMDAPKIQISQLLSETTKDCDNIVITVFCLGVTKKGSSNFMVV